jgi:hypothetical protein
MSSSDSASDSQRSFLEQARILLNNKNIDQSTRIAFFAALESVLTDPNADSLDLPPQLTPILKDVLKLIGRYIYSLEPVTLTADEQLRKILEQNRASPVKSFAERVSTSPVRDATKGDEGEGESNETPIPQQFSQDFVSSSEPGAPPPQPTLFSVEMTESDYEFLKEKLKERKASQSRSAVIEIPSASASDEVVDDVPLDASAVGPAVSSDFRIDGVTSLSEA